MTVISAPEGQGSETVILTYQKGNEEFEIMETVYEKAEEDIRPRRGLKK